MKKANIGVSDTSIDQIISNVDYFGNGQINYTEFLAATLSAQQTLTEEMQLRLFKRFDVDDTGFISNKNLLDVFKRLGHKQISLTDVTLMIQTHDIAKDGQISFEEFKVIFED